MNSATTHPRPPVTGIVLCGGAGKRAGGADKPLLSWHGKPMVEWVLQQLGPQVSDIVISANRNRHQYEQLAESVLAIAGSNEAAAADVSAPLEVSVLADEIPNFAGPLAGVHAALAKTRGWSLVCPGDAPNLPADLVQWLWQRRDTQKPLVVHDGTRQQHLHFLLPPSQHAALRAYLASGERSARGFHRACNSVVVHYPTANGFINLNESET